MKDSALVEPAPPLTTVIIRTIARATLQDAIDSAEREGFHSLVIMDAPVRPVVRLPNGSGLVSLGRSWGYYGGMAANVGAALARTPFVTFVDDDDQLVPGVGERLRADLARAQDIDILIGGMQLNGPRQIQLEFQPEIIVTDTLCMDAAYGLVTGNVTMSTFRTTLFARMPFADDLSAEDAPVADFFQIRKWVQAGAKLRWLGYPVHLTRPRYGTVNGRGTV